MDRRMINIYDMSYNIGTCMSMYACGLCMISWMWIWNWEYNFIHILWRRVTSVVVPNVPLLDASR